MIKGPYSAKQPNRTQHSKLTLNGNVWSGSDSPESLCNPRPSDPWTKASQLFADKSQDAGETITANWEASTTNNEWMTWIRPSPTTQPGHRWTVKYSPRANFFYSLMATFREIHKYLWALCLPALSLEKLPKSVRLTSNPWDLTGLTYLGFSNFVPGYNCVVQIIQMW